MVLVVGHKQAALVFNKSRASDMYRSKPVKLDIIR